VDANIDRVRLARYLINPVAESLVAMNQVLPARTCDSDDAPPVRAPR
jgi:hypothetical protein